MNPDDQELELLHALLNDEGIELRDADGIPRLDDAAPAPLSFQQERLWLLHQLDPESTSMNMSSALRLSGTLRIGALELALNEIVRRHEPLRTVFAPGGNGFMQTIGAPSPAPLNIEDLSRLNEADQDTALRRRLREEAGCRFDLLTGPVFRVVLFRCSDTTHVLSMVLHHIVADGWSIGVFAAELGAIYRTFSESGESPLPPLPVRYRDYAAWQRTRMGGGKLEAALDYWRRRLQHLTVLELPADRRRPALPGPATGGRCPVKFSPVLTRRMASLAEREGATLAMVTLTGLQALLSRYSGQSDIAVGIPVANRDLPQFEGLIGFFVNMLVIRTDCGGRPGFRQLLRQVRESTLSAFEWQAVPFQLLVDELKPDRVANRHPLFQVSLAYQNVPQRELALPGLTVTRVDDDQTARFDIEIFIAEQNGSLSGSIAYDTRLFDPATIARMAGHWVNLLTSAVAAPDLPIADIPLLDEAERREFLAVFNQTAVPRSSLSLMELFSRRVRQTPDAMAVDGGDTRWTFAEVDKRADRVAAFLHSLPYRAEPVIAILMERRPELIPAILGVIRAGACWLPLDPAHPADRIDYMIGDSRAVAVLGCGSAPRAFGVPWVPVDELPEPAATPVWQPADPRSLAYIIYTSGSTGRPKGSEITHEGLLNYLVWSMEAYEAALGTGALLHSSVAFDLTITSLFPALLAGRPVILVPESAGAGGLATALRKHGNSSPLKLTPAHMSVLNNLIAPAEAAACARVFVVGGEQLLPAHVAFWRNHAPATRLINEYGPTETVVGCCVHEVTDADLSGEAIPIGRPIANTRLYVLDRNLMPVPAGVPGELWIAGAGLARCYRFRPGLTAQTFWPDPFSASGERMYRTGDAVRRRPDGELEFLARFDAQVKLRGYRVEPGEIESVLAGHDMVREAVVYILDDRLVAWVVPAPLKTDWETEQVGQWRTMFERNYLLPPPEDDPVFNPIGWNSSYDGLPMPDREIREWQERTVAQLRSPSARRVFEIGCGSGLIVFALADTAEDYLACDFAAASVDMVGRLAAERGLTQVRLLCREASDFDGVDPKAFDLVIVNSVIQYFAGVDYLLGVIRGAVAACAEGGRVFVGDVRNLRLLTAYHASVQFYKAPDGMSRADLAERVRRGVAREEELVLDPDFFYALPRLFPEIAHVEIRLRTNLIPSELTKFRYDAILHIGYRQPGDGHYSLSPAVAHSLAEDLAVRSWLESDQGPETVGEMRAALRERSIPSSPPRGISEPGDLSLPWPACANNPLHAKLAQTIIPSLRQYLKPRLPDYMCPSDFVVVDRLPLTVNGKVDRSALPRPVSASIVTSSGYVPARSPEEEIVASIWADLLGLPRVSVTDDFFDLGGHSLLAAQVVSRLRSVRGTEVPLSLLFDEPTIAGLVPRLASLRDTGVAPGPQLTPVSRDRNLPLSFSQERLWFLEQLEPGRTTYNVPVLLRLSGPLDPRALEYALNELVNRHEVLRTRIVVQAGEASQVVVPSSPLALPCTDLRDLAADERQAAAHAVTHRLAGQLFDLAEGRLLRAALIRLADEEYLLELVTHHIASDGWSVGVAVRELVALYSACLHGEPSPLPALPVQYADYACWQREWLRGDVLEERLVWWRTELAEPPALDLPASRPRPRVLSGRGQRLPFAVSREATDRMQAMVRASGSTLFMAMLAAFYGWLQRETGQSDLVVGTPVANRQRHEIEPLIGFFVNTLALRMKVDTDASFAQLLDRTRRLCLAAYAHQDVPFEAVVEAVSPRRDPGRAPLFQVALVLLNSPRTAMELQDLRVTEEPVETGVAKFDLTLIAQETESGIAGEWEFSTDLFDEQLVRRFDSRFSAFLAEAIAAPETPLHRLGMLSSGEQRHVLETLNATAHPVPALTMPALLEAQAASTPGNTALVAGERTWTYARLNECANRLANYLIGLGAGPEDRIAVALDRSPEMVVALFAVMKAGSAYVPIDPAYPPARVSLMLADAAPALALSDLAHRDLFPGAICLDDGEIAALVSAAPEHNPERAQLDNAAYVIYTSGSTGTPKGVVVTHSGIASLAMIHIERLRIGFASRFLQFASLSFDSSVAELVMALGAGAALVFVPSEARSGRALAEFLKQERITHAQLPPAVLATLDIDLAEELFITDLIVAGEACPPDLAEAWSSRVRFFNAYGPTESTVAATLGGPLATSGPPPIGPPIWNTRAYVLDSRLEPVQTGAAGELYLAGAGIARGYFNRPALTAERFMPEPYGSVPGGRMYRTGDLARWRNDGSLEFLGRSDHQVKIRGFRVEPGEIEAALQSHPSVSQAAVVARTDAVFGKQLVAYVVGSCRVRDLREYLAERLPHYMVPSVFVNLPALPLTPHGKVDRAALPEPSHPGTDDAPAVLLPRSALEFRLVRIWEEVLGVSGIGVQDNFFTLGGHSLLAPKLLSRIERREGSRLPLDFLFRAGTVGEMAAAMEAGKAAAPFSPLVPIRPEGTLPPFFCVHPAAGSVFSYYELARSFPAGRPFYGLQAPGCDGDLAPVSSVKTLAAIHLRAIRTAFPSGPYHLCGHSFGATVAFEMACQLEQEDPRLVGSLVILDHSAPGPATGDVSELPEAGVFAFLAREIGAHFGIDLGVTETDLDHMPSEARLPLIVERAVAAGIATEGAGSRMLAGMASVYRASLRALSAYSPGRLRSPLVLFRSGDLVASGWENLVDGPVRVTSVAGTHTSMLRAPHVEALAALISEVLGETI